MRLLVIALLAFASTARADVPDPDEYICRGKSAGAACEDRESGVSAGACVAQKCSRSRPSIGPDGSQTVVSSEWDCMKCVAGAPTEGGNVRLFVGLGVAIAVLAGGVVLARRMKTS